MKKHLLIISALFLMRNSFAQNAPIAVSDTIYVNFNDSVCFISSSIFLTNDSDPDGDNIYHDTTSYIGLGTFRDIRIATLHRVCYQPPLDFHGQDSAQLVIKDDGIPVRYDTSTIYFIVKRKSYEYIDLNNIKARIGLNALFYDDENSLPAFEVPKGSGAHTIFSANLWVVGKFQDSIHGHGATYGFEKEYRSGPIMDSTHYEGGIYDEKWDRVWKINHTDIIAHQNNWNSGGYQPIEVIKNWPAHGDTTKGEAYYLAPFIDNNLDGKYNPLDGDYPKIKGQQAIYHIYNDVRNKKTILPMGSEIHEMAYVYNCPSDSAINHTVFVDYTIINRSNKIYDSTYVGMWVDSDIGGSIDDYVGCDVQRGTFYGYNGDDEDLNYGASVGYGVYPPAQGVTFLNGPFKDSDGIGNPLTNIKQDALDSNGIPYAGLGLGFDDGIIDNEQVGLNHFLYYTNNPYGYGGDPQSGLDYYNYLRARWRDSTQMVWGGNGHVSDPNATSIPSDFMFPGVSDPLGWSTPSIAGVATPNNWSENSVGNTPLDRRGLGSSGPFTFQPDSSVEITLAFVFGRDYQTTGANAGVVVMQERVDSIRNYFLSDFVSVCGGALGVKNNEIKNNDLLVYPNPFHSQFAVVYELKDKAATIIVYNTMGKQIINQSIQQKTNLIDLSNQANGVYFIQIVDDSVRITQKVLKQ